MNINVCVEKIRTNIYTRFLMQKLVQYFNEILADMRHNLGFSCQDIT